MLRSGAPGNCAGRGGEAEEASAALCAGGVWLPRRALRAGGRGRSQVRGGAAAGRAARVGRRPAPPSPHAPRIGRRWPRSAARSGRTCPEGSRSPRGTTCTCVCFCKGGAHGGGEVSGAGEGVRAGGVGERRAGCCSQSAHGMHADMRTQSAQAVSAGGGGSHASTFHPPRLLLDQGAILLGVVPHDGGLRDMTGRGAAGAAWGRGMGAQHGGAARGRATRVERGGMPGGAAAGAGPPHPSKNAQ